MTAPKGIYELLSDSNNGLPAIVGDRIHPQILPEDEDYPALVYSQLSEDELPSKDGPVNNGYLFQVDVHAKDYASGEAISRLVKRAINWKTAEIDEDEIGTLRFSFVDKANNTWDADKELFHTVLEFRGFRI